MSFFELFQPGLRHLREETDRLKSLVARPTHGGGAPLGIDLDTGKAAFTMPSAEPEADPAAAQSEPDAPAEPSQRDGTADGAPPADEPDRVGEPRRRSAVESDTSAEAQPRRARIDPAG